MNTKTYIPKIEAPLPERYMDNAIAASEDSIYGFVVGFTMGALFMGLLSAMLIAKMGGWF